jgi:hypothetical protein
LIDIKKGAFERAPFLWQIDYEFELASIAVPHGLRVRLALGDHFCDTSIEGTALLLEWAKA